MSKSRLRQVLAATIVSYVIVVLDASVVNVALDQLSTSLATNLTGLQWVVSAYTLAFACLLLTGGTLGDRLGARSVYLLGLLVFTVSSTICGFASNLIILVIARSFQGVGAALLVPCSLKLINDATSNQEQRARAMAIWVTCGGLAMAAGPLIGGLLIHLFGWRSIFFVNVPIGLVGILMTLRIARDEKPVLNGDIDVVGQISAIIALGLLIGILVEGKQLGWRSPLIIAGVVLMFLAWVVFFATEGRKTHPMLPLAFFKNGIFTGSAVVSMASAFVFYGLLFVMSIYYQQGLTYSPLMTGLAFVPMTVMVAVGSAASNRVVKLFGEQWSMSAAFGFYALGAMGLLSCSPSSPYWIAIVPMMAIGFASGFVSPAATAPAMGTVSKDKAGVAAAVLNSARQTGAALGVSVFGILAGTVQTFGNTMCFALWTATVTSLIAAVIWQLPKFRKVALAQGAVSTTYVE